MAASLTARGLVMPASQSASADVNTLDDYQEGTWTPAISFETSSNFSYDTRTGHYTKIGRLVHLMMHLQIDKTAGINNIIVTGIPFVAAVTTSVPILSSHYDASSGVFMGVLYTNGNLLIGHVPNDGAWDESNNGALFQNTTNIRIDLSFCFWTA